MPGCSRRGDCACNGSCKYCKIDPFPDADAALGATRGSANADGDDQKSLDVLMIVIQICLDKVPVVASYLSEEQDAAVPIHDAGTVIVASDPLDGSSNIDTNVSVGTIFSILPAAGGPAARPKSNCRWFFCLWAANHFAGYVW